MTPTETIINACRETFNPFFDAWVIKAWASFSALGIAYFLGADLHKAAVAIFVLITIDTITAVWSAKKTGTEITSRKFSRVLPKVIRYGLFLVAAHMVQGLVGFDIFIEDVVVVFLAATEFISIAENLAKLGMPIPARLLNKIEELRDKQ